MHGMEFRKSHLKIQTSKPHAIHGSCARNKPDFMEGESDGDDVAGSVHLSSARCRFDREDQRLILMGVYP